MAINILKQNSQFDAFILIFFTCWRKGAFLRQKVFLGELVPLKQ